MRVRTRLVFARSLGSSEPVFHVEVAVLDFPDEALDALRVVRAIRVILWRKVIEAAHRLHRAKKEVVGL